MPEAAGQRFVSVGTKVILATVTLLLLVATVVYFGLSSYERENLLSAKENSGRMLVALFSASLTAPIVFGDQTGVEETVRNLARNDDVLLVRAFAVDPIDGSKLGPLMGALERTQLAIPKQLDLPKSDQLTRSLDYVLLEGRVIDPTQKATVGAYQVALSLAHENMAIGAIERRVLVASAILALGLSLVLVVVARTVIIRPLGRLAEATKLLESGQRVQLAVNSNDEIGHLARRFQLMAEVIEKREQSITARNDDMRLVLDNVDQGMLTIDRDSRMAEERSRTLERWFGAPQPGWTLVEYLGSIEPELGLWFQVGWGAVLDDILPLELTLDQLPKRFTRGELFFEVEYRPILHGDKLSKVLVVISDATVRVMQERTEKEQRQLMVIFQHALNARQPFEEFMAESRRLVTDIVQVANDNVLLKRLVHTLKGNTAIYGLESVSELCHMFESRMEETGEALTLDQKHELEATWANIEAACSKLQVGRMDDRIELEQREYSAFLQSVRLQVDHKQLASMVASWRFEAATQRLERVADHMRNLGARLNKPVTVVTEPSSLRFPSRKWAAFWSAFAHIMRNTLDHGIESQEERLAAGKQALGHIALRISETEAGQIVLSIRDDGRGIAWDKVAHKAKQRGLPCVTREDLVHALFSHEFSTRDEVTQLSGRGVGLGVVSQAVTDMSGTIAVVSETGQGTTFIFTFPHEVVTDGPSLSLFPPRMPSAASG